MKPLQSHGRAWLVVWLAFAAVFFACSRTQYHTEERPPDAVQYEKLLAAGRNLINERRHAKALAVLEQAGTLLPGRPEWLHASARAWFAMGRFENSAEACRKALERDPRYYKVMALGWAARLEASGTSPKARHKVRREIESLLAGAGQMPAALLAAYQGYQWLGDEDERYRLALALAPMAEAASPAVRSEIADTLFEAALEARGGQDRQERLMHAYVHHFPDRRFVEYLVTRILEARRGDGESGPLSMAVVRSSLPNASLDGRIGLGVAKWLLEHEREPEDAVRILRRSIRAAESVREGKPPGFDDALWQKVLEKEKNDVRLLLGRALFQAGRLEQAEAELRFVAEAGRERSGPFYYLGRIAEIRGDADAAIASYRRALAIDDREKDAQGRLAGLLLRHRGYAGEPSAYFSRIRGSIRFSDVTEKAGLAGCRARRAAWGDYDRDGAVDLLLDGTRLYRNNGDGTFTDVTDSSGLALVNGANGGTWADYDNDGDLDVFATSRDSNHLLQNRGGGLFIDATDSALEHLPPLPTEAAAWGDMDNDGFLDLYTANYERKGVMRGLGTKDRLYRNNGDATFSEISVSTGIVSDEAMCGRGVTWSDVNRDGHQDIATANYRLDPNFLWINNGGRGFVDEAASFHVRGRMTEGAFGHSIGPAGGDLDGDGDPDLIITNLAHPRYIQYSDPTMVLMNQGPPSYAFVDRFVASGVSFEETNADPALADVDNDGDLDLYITSVYSGRNAHLYINDGTGRFSDSTWLSGVRVENVWGAAFADFNNDGFPDLAAAGSEGVTLYENNGNANHWVKVIIKDSRCNSHGIGSIIRVSCGAKTQVREVVCGRGAGSQDDTAVLFGLGSFAGPVSIEARTLCGDTLRARPARPDRTVVLEN